MNSNTLPTAIDVTLHKYNHIDNRLWVQIKNQLDYIEVDETSVVVSISQLSTILDANYLPMINRIKSTGSDFLHKKVTSPYFLYIMSNDMPNLQLVKITLSLDKKFTRLIESEGHKILKFEFKILAMTIDLQEMFDIDELQVINPILEELEILEDGIHYNRMRIVDVLDKIDYWIEKEIDLEYDETLEDPIPLLTALMDIIDQKMEGDNPLALIVTDY
jgi:hypothetical protein